MHNCDFIRTGDDSPTCQLELKGTNIGHLVQNCTFTDTAGDGPVTAIRLTSEADKAILRQITADGDLNTNSTIGVALQHECSWNGGADYKKLYQWNGSQWVSLISE